MVDIFLKVDDQSFDKAMCNELRSSRDYFKQNLEEECPNIFIYDDPVNDKALIQKYIEAFDLVIEWYGE